MRRVDITGIALEANTGAPLVVLREHDEPHRLLPIFIGGPEATAIAIAAAGERTPRPMVHDVMAALVKSLDGQVDRVEVTDIEDGTFFATINVTGPTGDRRVGSRPSDALALAVRTGAPVFVADDVLDVAGSLPPAEGEAADQDTAELSPELSADEIDAEVDSFRSLLDDLDPSDFIDTDVVEDTGTGDDGSSHGEQPDD